jgi:DNA polymerase (family 10)
MVGKKRTGGSRVSHSSYTDEKGRTRWQRNDEVAAVVKQLGEYLIIGGYPEDHAKRYGQLAHTISRLPELIDSLDQSGQLDTIPGIGGTITGYLEEIIRTGTTEKFNDSQYGEPPPKTVLELTAIKNLGAKTARMLYQDHGIDSLQSLCQALNDGKLSGIKGIGPKMIDTISGLCQ